MDHEAPDAPDTATSSQITDHPFDPVGGAWYAICKVCRLGRAAHTSAVPGSEPPHQEEVGPKEERPEPLPVAEIDKSQMEEYTAKCDEPGPAPGLLCSRESGHSGAHMGTPPQAPQANVSWGGEDDETHVEIEQDDPIGGGRFQEYLQAGPHVLGQRESYEEREARETYEQHEMAAVGSIDHLTRGHKVVDERQDLYGDAVPNIERIARGWSIIAESAITPQMVPLMMVWLKVVRESQAHLVDNLDDIEGYVEIMRRVVKELGS